ncbi:MAG: DUF3102 domain-containing protein [Gammaproteobacteria bacterium]|nr:DUF3102 domain-containing protein [Gammaproteobacteria bacterium]
MRNPSCEQGNVETLARLPSVAEPEKTIPLASTNDLVVVSDLKTSNLDQLAASITDHHLKAQEHAQSAIEHAFNVGSFLIQARILVPHGKWEEWVERNTGIPIRTARHYMKLADNKDALIAKSANVADLTVTEAVKLISGRISKPTQKTNKSKSTPTPQDVINQYLDACVAVSKLSMTPHEAFEVSQRAVSTLATAWERLADKEAESICDRVKKIIDSSAGGSCSEV